MKKNCPWCESEKSKIHLWLKDEFLTKKEFQIYECLNCGLLFTEPRPQKERIGDYYKSEEYYSHQENKKGFIPKLYETIKSVNQRTKFKMGTKGMKKGTILDIGCGAGDFLHTMETKGWKTIGIEPSEDAKTIAKKRMKGELFEPEEINQIPNESIDLITMWHVLEHVDDLKNEITQLERLLRKGGRLVLALPNFKSHDAQYYKEYWAAYDVPRHLNHFSKTSIGNIFKNSQLKWIETKKIIWDAYYISFMSEQYKRHYFALFRGFITGFISNTRARKTGEWSSLVFIFEKQ